MLIVTINFSKLFNMGFRYFDSKICKYFMISTKKKKQGQGFRFTPPLNLNQCLLQYIGRYSNSLRVLLHRYISMTVAVYVYAYLYNIALIPWSSSRNGISRHYYLLLHAETVVIHVKGFSNYIITALCVTLTGP